MQLGAANWVTFSANEMIYSVKRDHMLVKEGWGLHCALSHIMNDAYMFQSKSEMLDTVKLRFTGPLGGNGSGPINRGTR